MIKKFLMTTIVSLIVLNSYSEEIVIYKKGSTELPKDVSEKPIDIHVDESQKELSLVFNKSIEIRTIISGPEGVIYNDEISASRNSTLQINLKGSGEGNYDVLLIDNAGNVTDSSFYIPETN